jgi:outer membrane protein assembly factor BamB
MTHFFFLSDGQQKIFTPSDVGPVRRAFSSAAVIDDVLGQAYVADETGFLFAFNLSNLPAPIWNASFVPEQLRPLGIPSSPVVSPNGAFVCVTFTPRHINMSDPALNFTGSVSCMNSVDGAEMIHYEPNATVLGPNSPVLEVTPSISLDSTKVYVGTRRGILAFNVSDGQNASLPMYFSNSTLVAHAIGTPLALWEDFGVAFALSEDCHLHTFDLGNGSLVRLCATAGSLHRGSYSSIHRRSLPQAITK